MRPTISPATGLSTFTWTDPPSYIQPLWPIRESKSQLVDTRVAGIWLEYEHPFTWSQDVLILPSAEPGPKTLRLHLKVQVCDERSCLTGTHSFEVPLDVADSPAVPLLRRLEATAGSEGPPIQIVPIPRPKTIGGRRVARCRLSPDRCRRRRSNSRPNAGCSP